MEYLNAFLCGGLLCLIGQILIDKTSLTPAKILVCYVVTGVILGGLGVYKPLIEWAGAGATVPLTGFGYLLSKGVREAVAAHGFLGRPSPAESPPPRGESPPPSFLVIWYLFCSRPSLKNKDTRPRALLRAGCMFVEDIP